jgi:riboflavin biosynthesis protein RibD
MSYDEKYMHRCLQLAGYGRGFVSPNPLVGSVIIHDDKIIGEGFHRACGQAHAEVNAIASVKDKEFLKDATLYVNLEPCSHHGKTPPCADLIIRMGIPRVVVGMQDPFPEVAGRGIGRLREHGVEVAVGVLKEECEWLNRRFIIFHREHRPYVILKWAQSADGFMDIIRREGDGQQPVVFSNDFAQIAVHKLRAEEDAIMVGTNTERLDKPRLNVRYWDGKDPLKLIADSSKTLKEQLHELYRQNIQSLIVEGGAKLLASFIKENLWDEARIETAEHILLGEGVKAPVIDK